MATLFLGRIPIFWRTFFPIPGLIDTQTNTVIRTHVPLQRHLQLMFVCLNISRNFTGGKSYIFKEANIQVAMDFSLPSSLLLLHALVGYLARKLYNHNIMLVS